MTTLGASFTYVFMKLYLFPDKTALSSSLQYGSIQKALALAEASFLHDIYRPS